MRLELFDVRRRWPRHTAWWQERFREQRDPFFYCLLFNSSALYYLQTPTRRYGHTSMPPQFLLISSDRDVSLPLAWNGLCDHHWAEITVMQFTGHSLPVHHFFFTAQWEFLPCLILWAQLYFTYTFYAAVTKTRERKSERSTVVS